MSALRSQESEAEHQNEEHDPEKEVTLDEIFTVE